MAQEKKDTKREPPEPSSIDEAGKGQMDDEMLPSQGEPVEQQDAVQGNESPDTAGEHGDMAPETAKPLDEKREKEQR